MKRLFSQMAEHKISNAAYPEFIQKLPEVIRKNTDLEYKYQQRNAGCFLKPTFRNMPYRTSFVPEIDIFISNHEAYTMLHITGQPVKFVLIFMVLWFVFLSLMEVFLLILAITSNLDSIIPVFIPIAMCVFGYLLCELGTKATFNSVIKAIKKECS
ncbi:MAG: hypothetical protein IJX37_08700 [Oscillospiraceae bacterium]|nr:hypothetical protein [Oscillospiraceae bacterium]